MRFRDDRPSKGKSSLGMEACEIEASHKLREKVPGMEAYKI